MDATVLAVCGLSFRFQAQLFGDGPAVLVAPVDPARCCPQCLTAEQHARHPEEGAAVADLIQTLGGGSRR